MYHIKQIIPAEPDIYAQFNDGSIEKVVCWALYDELIEDQDLGGDDGTYAVSRVEGMVMLQGFPALIFTNEESGGFSNYIIQ